jgi:hypothetical protein
MKQQKTSIRFGEFFVRIEYCANCSFHNGSLRHDEQKYLTKAQKLKDLLSKEFPFLTIMLQPLQLQISSRLGCFEIYYADYTTTEEHLVSSKLKTLKWPESKVVINNIRNFMRPKKLEVGLSVKELQRLAEKQRNLDSVRCLLISEVDFPRVVECLKNLQTKSKISPSDLTSAVNRPRVGSCYSGKTSKTMKPIRQIQSGLVNKKTSVKGDHRTVGTAPEFRNIHSSSTRPGKKSRNRVLSAIVVRKLQNGETQADLIKHLLENKPCVFEEGVNQNSKVIFESVGPGRYRFIVLKDFNFQFGIKEIQVGPHVRPLDKVQSEVMEIETSDQAFFELRVLQTFDNPIVRNEFQRIKDEKKTYVEMEMVKKESAGEGKEFLLFRSNELKPGKYEANFEYNDYSEKKVEVEIHCGMNKFAMKEGEGLVELEPEGLPRFLDNEILTSQMNDLRVDDFYFEEEEKKRYCGEIPRIKRKKQKKKSQVIQVKNNIMERKMEKENKEVNNISKKKRKVNLVKKIKKRKSTNEKKKIKFVKKKKLKKKKKSKIKKTDPDQMEIDPATSNEYRMKAIFAEDPSKDRDFGKKLDGSMHTIPENPSEVNSKGFRHDNFSGGENNSNFDSIVKSDQFTLNNNISEPQLVESSPNKCITEELNKTMTNRSSQRNKSKSSKKKTQSIKQKTLSSTKKKKQICIKENINSELQGTIPSPVNSRFRTSASSFKMTPKNNAPFQASFNNEITCKPLTSRSNNQCSTAKRDDESKKARITSGNRIRPGERLPSAKSKASPSDKVQGQSRQAIPSFISSKKEEICFLEWFSEFEDKVDHGSINIFCSKSSNLDCSFILSESEPPRPIKSFNVCNGSFQQVMIPLSVEKPILCRLFFEIIKPQIDEEVLVVLYSCNNWLAFRLSDYIKSTYKFGSDEKFCDLALCNLSTGVMLPMLSLTKNRPEVGTGISEIRKLVSFVQNSKFAVSKFFGFDEEQMEDTAQEYTLSAMEAKESLNNYEITGDLDYLLSSVRCNSSGRVSLALIERMFQIWKELVKQTENFELDESFHDDEEFDEMEETNDEASEFGKEEFEDDLEYSDAFIKVSDAR